MMVVEMNRGGDSMGTRTPPISPQISMVWWSRWGARRTDGRDERGEVEAGIGTPAETNTRVNVSSSQYLVTIVYLPSTTKSSPNKLKTVSEAPPTLELPETAHPWERLEGWVGQVEQSYHRGGRQLDNPPEELGKGHPQQWSMTGTIAGCSHPPGSEQSGRYSTQMHLRMEVKEHIYITQFTVFILRFNS